MERGEACRTAFNLPFSHYFHAWGGLFWCEQLIVGDGHMARTRLIFLGRTGITLKNGCLFSSHTASLVSSVSLSTPWFHCYSCIFQISSDSKIPTKVSVPLGTFFSFSVLRGFQSIIVIFRQLVFPIQAWVCLCWKLEHWQFFFFFCGNWVRSLAQHLLQKWLLIDRKA